MVTHWHLSPLQLEAREVPASDRYSSRARTDLSSLVLVVKQLLIQAGKARRRGSDTFPIHARHNSINFLRLVLAFIVVISHAIALGNVHVQNGVNQSSFGQLAVYGFFGISGYLIAGSVLRNSVGRYIWQRFLRILPGFWFCLIVTAFGIGFVACRLIHRSCVERAATSPHRTVQCRTSIETSSWICGSIRSQEPHRAVRPAGYGTGHCGPSRTNSAVTL